MASALMVWGMSVQAQTSGGGMAVGQGAIGQQTRPAPVSGKVGSDPAAVALRPAAAAPVTSKATQVAPPANPNEPLFSSAAETPARATATPPATQPTPLKNAEPVTQQRKPHVDRTKGVKKPGKTEPQAHDKKASGKPRHGGGKSATPPESGGRDAAPHQGKKKGDKHAVVSRVKTAAKVHEQAQPAVASSHAGKSAGKHVATAKPQAKPSHRQVSATALATAGKHASPAHAAHKDKVASSVSRQHAMAAKSPVAAKASAPTAKRSAKAARTHKAV